MNYRFIFNEDGTFSHFVQDSHAHWSRFGCYGSEDEAVRAATFLFGEDTWAIRWSGCYYIVAPGEATVPEWA